MKSYIDIKLWLESANLGHLICDEFLAAGHEFLRLPARHCLFVKGQPMDSIYLILYGSFRLQDGEDSSGLIYSFKARGKFLGIFSFYSPAGGQAGTHVATAITMEETAVLKFSLSTFQQLLSAKFALRKEIGEQMAVNFRDLQEDREMDSHSVAARLAHVLLQILQNLNSSSQSNRVLPLRLTKKDLARKIGSEPETISRILSSWTRDGIIQQDHKSIEIVRKDELQRIRA